MPISDVVCGILNAPNGRAGCEGRTLLEALKLLQAKHLVQNPDPTGPYHMYKGLVFLSCSLSCGSSKGRDHGVSMISLSLKAQQKA